MEQLVVKETNAKMEDYKRFAIVSLALSGFLFLGLLIPYEGKDAAHAPYLIGANFLFIFSSAYFFQKALNLKKKIDEMNS
jgi:hypothetical protein